jgi:hypothetical protein
LEENLQKGKMDLTEKKVFFGKNKKKMFIGQSCKVVMQVGGKHCLAFNGFFLPIN